MNEEKNIELLIVGEHGEVEWRGDSFFIGDLKNLIIESQKLDLICIGSIDLSEDTYFNQKQCSEIFNNELTILKKNKNFNEKLIHSIEIGSKKVLENSWSYLKIATPMND